MTAKDRDGDRTDQDYADAVAAAVAEAPPLTEEQIHLLRAAGLPTRAVAPQPAPAPKRRRRRPLVDEPLAELVARSRAEQGLPPKVEDPGTLAKVATIFGASPPAPPPK